MKINHDSRRLNRNTIRQKQICIWKAILLCNIVFQSYYSISTSFMKAPYQRRKSKPRYIVSLQNLYKAKFLFTWLILKIKWFVAFPGGWIKLEFKNSNWVFKYVLRLDNIFGPVCFLNFKILVVLFNVPNMLLKREFYGGLFCVEQLTATASLSQDLVEIKDYVKQVRQTLRVLEMKNVFTIRYGRQTFANHHLTAIPNTYHTCCRGN